MTKTKIIAEPGKPVIQVTYTFDAPRELVFAFYTDRERIPQWWGPSRLTTTVEAMDVRMGGIWRFVQRDGEGHIYAFHGVYHEVRSPERLVDTFEYEGTPGHVLLETMMFEEQDGKTKLTGNIIYQTVADRDEMLEAGMEGGEDESLERLAALLASVI